MLEQKRLRVRYTLPIPLEEQQVLLVVTNFSVCFFLSFSMHPLRELYKNLCWEKAFVFVHVSDRELKARAFSKDRTRYNVLKEATAVNRPSTGAEGTWSGSQRLACDDGPLLM